MSRKALIFFLIGGLLFLLGMAGLFIDRYYREKNIPLPQPVSNDEVIVEVMEPEPIIVIEESLETIPEEVEEEIYQIFEKDGATYIIVEDVEILLVNKVYALPAEFGGVNSEAESALEAMFEAALEDDISLFLMSGYRSYETQAAIYASYVSDWGQEYTDTVSARAGHSEHQTGLTFDLNSLSRSFTETKEYEWLQQNCADFGFILRYPEGSEWATGFAFEPWHYRYIYDSTLAKKIMDSKLSLEEYSGLVTEEGHAEYLD